jgi:hypothetical protein
MKSINATKINRKFGKPRDLQFSGPLVEVFSDKVVSAGTLLLGGDGTANAELAHLVNEGRPLHS